MRTFGALISRSRLDGLQLDSFVSRSGWRLTKFFLRGGGLFAWPYCDQPRLAGEPNLRSTAHTGADAESDSCRGRLVTRAVDRLGQATSPANAGAPASVNRRRRTEPAGTAVRGLGRSRAAP